MDCSLYQWNYYLGFDYWTAKKNGNSYNENEVYGYVKPDGYYNDWIIKLSNGTHLVSSYTRRIMCEDLGDTFDWDFNDLVFDVTIYNGQYGNGQSGYYAQIMLQAAGGTLPIYIGEKKPEYEAHFLFGVPTTTPVNVDAVGGVKRPAVEFNLPIPEAWVIKSQGDLGQVYSIDFEKIPIIVDRSGSGISNNESAIVLTANKGQAPQKFACPSDTYWMKEFQNIEGIENKQIAGHPNFAKWVSGDITEEFVDEDHQDASAFVTARSKAVYKHFEVLYADPNGSPYSVSWWSTGDDSDQIRPWRELWMEKPDDEQFTAPRSVPKYVKSDGTANIDKDGYTTYSTTFQAQAPFIYETRGEDDDPTAYSPHKIEQIIREHYANQEVAWSPEAKKVELKVDGKGYVLGSGYYHKGATFDITAVPGLGQLFSRWVEVPGERTISEQSTFQITNLNRDLNYKAIFVENPNPPSYHVYFACDPVGAGYIQNKQGQTDLGTYNEGANVQFVAMNNRGYMFNHWENGSDNETRELTVAGETTITATYDVLTAYNITVRANNDSWGTVSIGCSWPFYQQGNGVYYEWDNMTIGATAKQGHSFVRWECSVNSAHPFDTSEVNFYLEDEFGYEPPSEIIFTAIFQ